MTKLIFALVFLSSSAFAEIVFDGYYKIENDGKHVGFAVRRLEVDKVKKTRTLRLFLNTIDRDKKSREETLVAVSGLDLHPIESDYTENVDGKQEHVQLKSDGKTYQNVFQSKDGKSNESFPLITNEVFSSAGLDLLLANKPKKNTFYSYMGLRENLGTPNRGQIFVINSKPMGKLQVFRVYDFFEINPVETWIASNGEILKEVVPARKVVATLVKDADAAIPAEFNRAVLTKTFNEIPLGKKNVLANAKTVFPEFPEAYNQKYTFDPYATPLKTSVSK